MLLIASLHKALVLCALSPPSPRGGGSPGLLVPLLLKPSLLLSSRPHRLRQPRTCSSPAQDPITVVCDGLAGWLGCGCAGWHLGDRLKIHRHYLPSGLSATKPWSS